MFHKLERIRQHTTQQQGSPSSNLTLAVKDFHYQVLDMDLQLHCDTCRVATSALSHSTTDVFKPARLTVGRFGAILMTYFSSALLHVSGCTFALFPGSGTRSRCTCGTKVWYEPVIVHVFVCLQGLNFQLAAVLLSIGIYAYIESGRSTYMTRVILCSNLCECNKVASLHSQGVHVNSCLCDIQERKQYRHNGKIEIEKSFMI